MITIRQEQEDDFQAIEHVHKQAFEQSNEANLVHLLRSSRAFVSELSLVAEMEEEIVGHLLFSKVHIGDEGNAALALAPIGVLPSFQQRGIGMKLIDEGIKRATKLSYEVVVVLGEPKYYHRFGFHTASEHNVQAPFDVPEKFFMVLELKKGALRNLEGVVTYPDAFMNV